MSETSEISAISRLTTTSTLVVDDGPSRVFKAFVADINFRLPKEGMDPWKFKRPLVSDVIHGDGPSAIMGNTRPQIRWIHLPANCMVWVEDLMKTLSKENKEHIAPSMATDSGPAEKSRFASILRDELWTDAFHGRYSKDIHSRFMMPFSARYASVDTEDPDTDDNEAIWQNANVTLLYLPYLHWETYEAWKNRQQLISDMKKTKKNEPYSSLRGSKHVPEIDTKRSEALLHKHLLRADPLEPPPLHDRRTLDQSYFYNLRNVAYRDSDQVIGQNTMRKEEEQPDQSRKMMMVDQLWMWAVDGNTIITAFPETGTGDYSEADVLTRLTKHIPRAIQQGLKSMTGLIALIVDHCTGVFHRSDLHPDLAFFEFFADDIGATKDELDSMSRRFRETSTNVESMWANDKVTSVDMSRELDKLFTIRQEIGLMVEVEKILADLKKIDFLYSQQDDVINSLVKNSKSSRSLSGLRETVQHRRNAWSGMAVTARGTYDSLRDLLDLKQRQANVSEARTARYQIEISSRHGRSVLLFTIITIIFLPMSVIATMLGMNVTELNGQNKLRMWLASLLLFPPSLAIAAVSLALAFGWKRVYLWSKEVTGLTKHASEGERRRRKEAEEGRWLVAPRDPSFHAG